MHEGGNGAADDDADSRWMSYAELAEARRITLSSAIRLVVRRGWRRQMDNQGTMRALVPPKWSEPAPGKDFDPGGHLRQTIEELEASVAVLRQRAETAERTAETERDRAQRAEVARRAEYQPRGFSPGQDRRASGRPRRGDVCNGDCAPRGRGDGPGLRGAAAGRCSLAHAGTAGARP